MESTHRDESPTKKANMSPIPGLSTALEVAREMAARLPPAANSDDINDLDEALSKLVNREMRKLMSIDFYDWKAGVSLLQFSFILGHIVPIHWFNFCKMSDWQGVAQRSNFSETLNVDGFIKHTDNSNGKIVECVGSWFDSLSPPKELSSQRDLHTNAESHSDMDVMIVDANRNVIREGCEPNTGSLGVIETGETRVGYVRLRLVHPEEVDCRYRCRKSGTSDFYYAGASLKGDICDSSTDRVHGPALRRTARQIMREITGSLQVDFVIAMSCQEWPKEADHWKTRQRPSGWPSKQLIQRVIAGGCHVVPTSHPKSMNPDVEWRYSFSVAERTLAQSLTDIQRQCYVLLKTIVMHELSRPDILCSYHLKTLLFWQCEKIGALAWSICTGLAASLLSLLDELLLCVANQYLPNYFIPECNLFDHVHPDFLADVARTLNQIRHEPLRYVLAFIQRCQLIASEGMEVKQGLHLFCEETGDLSDVFSDVIGDATMCYENPRKRYEHQQDASWALVKQCLKEQKNYIAAYLYFSKQLVDVAKYLTGDDYHQLALVICACLENNTSHAIDSLESIEQLTWVFPDSCYGRSYTLSNLACLYHAAAFSDVRKNEMLEKAEENFLKAMSDTGTNDAMIKVDYSMFLVHLHRYDEATYLLKQIIASECKHPVSSNTYRSNMKNITEDENLLKEIDHIGRFRTASHAFAYYVLAKIYWDTDRKADAETLLPDFQRLCSDNLSKGTVDVTMRARAFSLLGYVYLAVYNYSQAGQAFEKAAHLVDGYTLAEVNRNLCDAFRLCIQPLSTLDSRTVSETEATQFNELARNTSSEKRQATNQQPLSQDPAVDIPAENTEIGNMIPSSVGTDSTIEPVEHGVSECTAPDSLNVYNHDWTAGVSLLQLSFVLDQFLPQRHVRHSVAAATKGRIDAMLSRHCANLHDIKLEPVGSSYDLLQTPIFHQVPCQSYSDDYALQCLHHQRLDLMAVHMHQSVVREGCETGDSFGVIEAVDTHVGYIRIRLLHPPVCANNVHTSDTADVYLSSIATTREFKEGPLSSVIQDIAQVLHRGPAITANDVENTKWNSVDVDVVLALRCPEWPKVADHWPTRQRPSGWPSKQLIQHIIADGCHIVPISHPKSRNPDLEWRYSFSVAEHTLAQSLTDNQRQCYILLKTIVMHELSHSNVLTTYHMKTVFFWQCEKIPASEWSTDTGLAANLLWLLDELVYCVATHCLPHYFMPENNLLDHINPDFLSDVTRTLSCNRRDPLRHVLAFNKRFRFRFSVVSCDLANILSHVIDEATSISIQLSGPFVGQWFALEELGKQHMREKRYGEAYCVFAQLLQIRHRVSDIDSDATPCSQMSFACLELEAAQALGVFEYLVTTFPDDLHIHSLLGNLACMYHSAAFAKGNADKRQEMLQKADENFVKTVACSGVNVAACQTNYSMLLLYLHRYEEATVVLKKITFSECHNPVAINFYQENDMNTVEDENLINEINRHSDISTFSVAFAYYLLAKIYCDTDRQREAEKLLPNFQRLCDNTLAEGATDFTLHARAYSLLGYSYTAVQDYSKAEQAFGKAAQLADDYTLAEQNWASCDGFRRYTLARSDEDVCFYNREAASLKTPKKNFGKDMACSGGNVDGSLIGYRIFYLPLLPSKEYTVLLKQIICSERHNPVAVICYRVSENTIEDKNLINEIKIHKVFFTFSVAFAYYLLVKIYGDTDRQREADKLLPDFQRMCNDTLAEGRYSMVHARANSLLGYSYMAVHDYTKAGQAFGKAAQLADGYTLAEENRASCDVFRQLNYLVAKLTDDQHMDKQPGNVACIYHSAAFAAGNEDKRQEMLQKVEENFLKSTTCGGVNVAANQTDYSMFLLHLHRYEEATVVLKQVISSECNNPVGENVYDDSKRNSIEDENLINEINYHSNITTFSVAFAYYLLAKIYCHTDRQRKAEKLLPDFQRLCNDTLVEGATDSTLHARAYSLLGYSYLAVQDYSKAGKAFGKAAQLADDYTLAEDNWASCDGFRRYTLARSDEDVCFYNREAASLKMPKTNFGKDLAVQDYSKAGQAFGKAAQLADGYTLAEENRASCDVNIRCTLARSDEDEVCFYNREAASLTKNCPPCDVLRRRSFEDSTHSLPGNLACMYQSAAFATGNEDKRQMLQKACSGVNVAASQVDHCLFLVHLQRYEEAITVLKQVISSECHNPVARNTYGDERNTFGYDYLTREIKRCGKITTFSVALAYNILADIYCDTGRRIEAEKLLPDFHRLCNNTLVEGATDSTLHARAYSLLCESYNSVQEYSKAMQTFRKAAKLSDDYTLPL